LNWLSFLNPLKKFIERIFFCLKYIFLRNGNDYVYVKFLRNYWAGKHAVFAEEFGLLNKTPPFLLLPKLVVFGTDDWDELIEKDDISDQGGGKEK